MKRRTTILIEEEDIEWLRKHHINLGSFVRDAIKELKEKYKKLEE